MHHVSQRLASLVWPNIHDSHGGLATKQSPQELSFNTKCMFNT